MTVLLADQDGFRLRLNSPRFTGPFPVTIQASGGTADQALCAQPLSALLQCEAVLAVTAFSPELVHVKHVPLPGVPGEAIQAILAVKVVQLLEAA